MCKEVTKHYLKPNANFSLNILSYCFFLLLYSLFALIHPLSHGAVFMQLSNFTIPPLHYP